jgi:hypothetical protein
MCASVGRAPSVGPAVFSDSLRRLDTLLSVLCTLNRLCIHDAGSGAQLPSDEAFLGASRSITGRWPGWYEATQMLRQSLGPSALAIRSTSSLRGPCRRAPDSCVRKTRNHPDSKAACQ